VQTATLKSAVVSSHQEVSMPKTHHDDRLAFTVMWEVRDGEAEAAADIITRFAPEARKEPGLELLMVNQCATNPSQFLFYEVFTNAAAFEAHQETPHFRTLILEDALPRLTKRERVQYTPL
jgi:quinol monooxygenase YgiN